MVPSRERVVVQAERVGRELVSRVADEAAPREHPDVELDDVVEVAADPVRRNPRARDVESRQSRLGVGQQVFLDFLRSEELCFLLVEGPPHPKSSQEEKRPGKAPMLA